MTRSKILSYIQNYPDTWKVDLRGKNIRMKQEGDLCIFNYDQECDFSDHIVQEARGIIINLKTMSVVCWPFRKFGNWNEPYADTIDWSSARVQEKLDGSIIKLWFNEEEDLWFFSTNGVIDASTATLYNDITGIHNFRQLIGRAVNHDTLWDKIADGILDKDCTYIFELTSPYQQIVVPYKQTKLWHIGTRNNKTGEECMQDIGIEHPKEYPIHTFKQCLSAAKALNNTNTGIVEQEGFVVVDKNWHRIKVKSPEYLSVHHLLGNNMISKDRALEIISLGMEKEAEKYPQINAVLAWYKYQIAEFEYTVSKYIAYVRGMFEEVGHDRKAVAEAIKNDALSPYGFAAIGNHKTAKEIIGYLSRPSWKRHLKNYADRKD